MGDRPAPERLRFLDALRGFAIAGILLVNIPDLTYLGYGLEQRSIDHARTFLDFAVQTRFVPIFEFLFGVSMWFLVRGARGRGRSPWPPLLLRMVALLGIGLLHLLIYPGEILSSYAVFGLCVLPVVVLAPRWLTLGFGAVLTGVVLVLFGRSAVEAPGLMLLGAGAAAYGLPVLLERGSAPIRWVFAAAIPCGALALWWQTSEPGDPRFTAAGGYAGMVLAVAYVTGLSWCWRTRVRRVLSVVFEPLGRMALTNYVSASLMVVPAGAALHFTTSSTVLPALMLGVGIIAPLPVRPGRMGVACGHLAHDAAELSRRESPLRTYRRVRRRGDHRP